MRLLQNQYQALAALTPLQSATLHGRRAPSQKTQHEQKSPRVWWRHSLYISDQQRCETSMVNCTHAHCGGPATPAGKVTGETASTISGWGQVTGTGFGCWEKLPNPSAAPGGVGRAGQGLWSTGFSAPTPSLLTSRIIYSSLKKKRACHKICWQLSQQLCSQDLCRALFRGHFE